MNSPGSFQLGWALFFVAGIGGAYLGYQRNQNDEKVRIEQNKIYQKDFEERIRRLDQGILQRKEKAQSELLLQPHNPKPIQ